MLLLASAVDCEELLLLLEVLLVFVLGRHGVVVMTDVGGTRGGLVGHADFLLSQSRLMFFAKIEGLLRRVAVTVGIVITSGSAITITAAIG